MPSRHPFHRPALRRPLRGGGGDAARAAICRGCATCAPRRSNASAARNCPSIRESSAGNTRTSTRSLRANFEPAVPASANDRRRAAISPRWLPPGLRQWSVLGRTCRTGSLPTGVRLTSLADAVRADRGTRARAVRRPDAEVRDALAALNLAFMAEDGCCHRRCGRRELSKSRSRLLHLPTPGGDGRGLPPPHAIIARPAVRPARSSRRFCRRRSDPSIGRTVTRDPRRRRCHAALLQGSRTKARKAFHTATTDVRDGRQAGSYENFVLTTGGVLSRNEITVVAGRPRRRLPPRRLLSRRAAASMPTTRPTILHAQAADHQRGDLQGRARRAGAWRLPGPHHRASRTRRRSTAISSTRPSCCRIARRSTPSRSWRSIADDVKCSHGATVGELDEDALFYLRARGIGQAEARQMLVEAFVDETLDDIVERSPCATAFERRIGGWMTQPAREQPHDRRHPSPSSDRRRNTPTYDLERVRARLPDPGAHGARPAPGVPRQRRQRPEAARGHRRHQPLLRGRVRQRPSRRLLAERARDPGLRGRPRDGGALPQRPRCRRDHLHPQRHRGDQPRGLQPGRRLSSRPATRS